MGRLIEVQDASSEYSRRLTVEVGDVIQFAASGGHVRSGVNVVEMLGPLVGAVLANDGCTPSPDILAPMGPPNTVLFVARLPGRAIIDVVTGDPWHTPRTTVMEIDVRAPSGELGSPRSDNP
jgi:hypothetical protein